MQVRILTAELLSRRGSQSLSGPSRPCASAVKDHNRHVQVGSLLRLARTKSLRFVFVSKLEMHREDAKDAMDRKVKAVYLDKAELLIEKFIHLTFQDQTHN